MDKQYKVQAMDTTQLEQHKLMCVEAFKKGDHDEALRLLPSLQQPATVRTNHLLVPAYECTNVSLLHLAALHGWMDIVASLVCEYNCSSQCCDSRGHTPLHYAAHGGSLPVVQYLITEQHCDPLQCSNDGNNSVMYTCQSGHLDVVKYFITYLGINQTMPNSDGNMPLSGQVEEVRHPTTGQNFDPNRQRKDGFTLLHCACQNGNISLVKYLITELGCDLKLPDKDGNLPLHIACLNGQFDVVKYLLLDQKCDLNSRGKDGGPPLHSAIEGGNMSLVKYLITELGCVPETPDNYGDMEIHVACIFGKFDVLKYLIEEKNCDPHTQGQKGLTPLHYACQASCIDVIQYLITEQGCDPMSQDNHGNMPIHIACLAGQFKVLKYLVIEHKCDPHTRGQKGWSPLHCACLTSQIDVIQYLITELGCDPMSQNNDGYMPIHIACLAGQFSVLKYFVIEHEYDPQCLVTVCLKLPGHMKTIFDIFCHKSFDQVWIEEHKHLNVDWLHRFQDLAKVLTADRCHVNASRTLLHLACQSGNIDIMRYLIKGLGFDPALPDNIGNKPIHIACSYGQLDAVKYLITEVNCDPCSPGGLTEYTPLHCACESGNLKIIVYLTELGCAPASPDCFGNQPLHIACAGGCLNAVKYLINEAKCDAQSRGLLGNTPLHYACEIGHVDIVKYLIAEVGCNPASLTNNYAMPIHSASAGGHLNVLKYLIEEVKCDPFSHEESGMTPLHFGCQFGHIDIVHYLITEIGCDPASLANNYVMPIHNASVGGHLNVLKYLIGKVRFDPFNHDKNGMTPMTPLHCACQFGHMDIVQYLITEIGCDPALPDNDGNLPIHIACLAGQFKVLKYLVTECKCDPGSQGENGRMPIHYACLNGHMDIIQYLITELDCDPMSRDNDGNMPTHIACLAGQFKVLKYLITEHKCNPYSRVTVKLEMPIQVKVLMDMIRRASEHIDDLAAWFDRNRQLNMNWLYKLHNLAKFLTPDHCHLNVSEDLLHLACGNNNIDIIRYLIKGLGFNPALPDLVGNTPIHFACMNGQLNIVKYLVTEAGCNSHIRGVGGTTPLHSACVSGNMDIIHYLITEVGCDPVLQDDVGNTPVHIASLAGHLSVVKYLVTKHNCDLCSQGCQGVTPLHCACANGHMDIIQYLITERGCDPMSPDYIGSVPLHSACFGGKLDVVKYLITKHNCNPYCKGHNGTTPLHVACGHGHIDIMKYFINELRCNLNIKDDNDQTPLHLACSSGHTQIIRHLLQYGDVNLLVSANELGHTPVDYAELSDNSFELLKMFQPLLQSKDDYPIHTYTKAVLTGNSGAGKSSLAQIIAKQATTRSRILLTTENEVVIKVKTLTAGIESHVIKSKKVGNLVLYDLAGQSEYYFSQSVMMETVMQKTPAIFINLVNLNKSEDEIAQAIHYWLTFIENATVNLSTSCIIMVGSHIDLLTDEEQIELKCKLVEELVERRVTKLKYLGFVGMDCHKFNADGNAMFFPLLSKCRESISSCAPPVSVYCHMLYAFLQTKLDKIACQLQDVVSFLAADEESPLPLEVPLLSKLLEDLSDKGLIIYLKNEQSLEKSWVVVKREIILKDVNEVLFAPKDIRKYHPIASSTGIICFSSIITLFPKYDPEMLVEFMVCLEFCHPVNLSGIETNLQPIASSSIENAIDYLLFFPSLLHAERPQSLNSRSDLSCSQQLSFGWCLGCINYKYQFLTTRFLHVLLLRLAYTFPLPRENYLPVKTHSLHGLERRCTVWTNGIAWNNNNGVRTVVEVIQQNRWIVVTMFCNEDTRPVEYSRHRSAVIRLVLNLQQELALDQNTFERLISPSLLQQWPLESVTETDLFSVKDVARCVLLRDPYILSTDGRHQLATSNAVYFEPYHRLSPSSVCELMDSSKSDQPVSLSLLREVRECCQLPQLESQSYLSLREHLNKRSIYAGRNPLVVAKLDPDTLMTVMDVVEVRNLFNVNLSMFPDGTLDHSHLSLLVTALNEVHQWFELGLHLGLSYSTLKTIETNCSGKVEMCRIEVLAKWLNDLEEKRTKQFLQSALQKLYSTSH